MISEKDLWPEDQKTSSTGDSINPASEEQEPIPASEPVEPDDDDMIYPDNHLDDDDRYFLFPGQNTD